MTSWVQIVFKTAAGEETPVEAEIGQSLLLVAQAAGLDVEGACEGNMACATCHMIFDGEPYAQLPAASEEEEEMLDIAVGLTPTSRLGCQVVVREDMAGWVVMLPETSGALGF